MNEQHILFTVAPAGGWQAQGRLLGRELTLSAASLWDCLEDCKQAVWDIEIEHDVSTVRFSGQPSDQGSGASANAAARSDDVASAPREDPG